MYAASADLCTTGGVAVVPKLGARSDIITSIGYTVIDTSADDGAAAGWMRPVTRAHGLSLGDRLCLAAAQRLKAQVHTADRAWLDVADALQLDIRCIRPGTN